MPNNLDMGGFGSPGLPLLKRINDVVPMDRATASGTLNLEVSSPATKSLRLEVPSLPNGATLPAEWQQRGTKFAVDNTGDVWSASGNFKSAGHYMEFFSQAYTIMFSPANGRTFEVSNGGYVALSAGGFYGINSGSIAGTSPDVKLYRDAAGVWNMRNGTTAQTLRVTRSYTDAANFAWLTHKWNTTTAVIHAEGSGTGSDGSVAFNDAVLATTATVGFLMIPSCAGTPSGTPSDIPTGQIPLVWDSTNLKLYAYTGGAWKASAAFT